MATHHSSTRNICYITISFLFILIRTTVTWNLDVRKDAIFRNVNNSYFGYSLAVFEEIGRAGSIQKLLVGAPTGMDVNGNQGMIYQCSFKTPHVESLGFGCKYVKFDRTKSQKGWMGATIISSQGSATVCATLAYGECYSSVKSLTLKPVPMSQYIDKTGAKFCTIGLSGTYLPIHYQKEELSSFVGATGATCPSITEIQKDLKVTSKWANLEGRYGSYAMASGTYGKRKAGGGTFILSSVGLHINSSFAGKVFIVVNSQTHAHLTGYQPGEHFGASLAVTDLNGDDQDDIIIGAPHYTDYVDSALKFEIGAVYIYYQTSKYTFERGEGNELILKGQITGGRFGLTVAAIGDTNADGFNDLAIGAPYENERSGTVYIFHGSSTGLSDRPAQIISGNAFTPPLTTFGFAITAFDFDSNGYNDIFVGAYNSSAVVYIPARPIVNIESELQFVTNMIQIQKKTCYYNNYSDVDILVACSEIKFCVSYTGKGIPEMKMNISFILDNNVEKNDRRLKFMENGDDEFSQEIMYNSDKKTCHRLYFFVIPDINETLSVVQAKMTIQPIPSKNLTIAPISIEKSTSTISQNSLSIFSMEDTPWWQYIAGVVGAILILAITTLILYKVGFFKRKLPPTQETNGDEVPIKQETKD